MSSRIVGEGEFSRVERDGHDPMIDAEEAMDPLARGWLLVVDCSGIRDQGSGIRP